MASVHRQESGRYHLRLDSLPSATLVYEIISFRVAVFAAVSRLLSALTNKLSGLTNQWPTLCSTSSKDDKSGAGRGEVRPLEACLWLSSRASGTKEDTRWFLCSD